MDGSPTLTVSEYAAHRGVSSSFVRRMRRKGHVVESGDGRIFVDATDQLLDNILNPVHGGKRGPLPTDPPAASATSISVHEAVRRERLARARLAELELAEKSKQLTRVDDVNRAVFTLVRQAVNKMLGQPGRLRAMLAKETDAHRCGQILEADVALICTEMRTAAMKLLMVDDQPGDESDGEDDGEAEDVGEAPA